LPARGPVVIEHGARGAGFLNSSRPLRGSSPRRHRCRWVPCS